MGSLREKMDMITKAFLQKEVKSISRDELVVGDHIYSWRKAKIYSHHVFDIYDPSSGIYMGDDQVIHFMGQKPQVRNFWDKITSGSLMNHGGGKDHKVCPNCGDQSNLDGVISSCLDCFLKGGNLYRYEYSFSLVDFLYKARRGTCTIAASDPCGEVIHRATFLLLHNGFGAYHFSENNCEDFAIYCKTSKLVGKRVWFGRNGQANLLSVSGLITKVIWPPLSDAISVISDMRLKNGAGKVYVEDLVALKGKRLREKMRMITKAFLQKEVKSISRDELVVGDHIYSWRKAKIYSHHGIYMGDDQVIHFMGQKPQVRNFWDKITSGSLMNHGGGKDHKVCPNCGDQSNLDGVISSCLDCFLKGGNLYRYEYSFSLVDFLYKARRGTCTIAASDPCGEVIHRATFLLLHNGFGAYHFSENNCEDFAIYCKTSKLVGKRVWFGRSGQANLLSVSGLITQVIWPPFSDAISVISDIRLMNGAGKVYVEDLVALKGKRLREKMGMITKAFLQKEVKIISRDELVVGDHIYSWRKAKIYSHHGIYMGDDQVIHFMGQKPQVRNFWDKITSGSLMNHGGGKDHKVCPNCGDQSNLDGVISSCLDCFLKGDNLYRYEYSFSLVDFLYKARRGTCTTAASDPCGEVIHRAKFLLLHNGFGVYHFSENNCEDFAIYCKTSKLVGKKVWFGRNGQANLLNVSGLITQVSWPLLNDAISVISDMRLKNGTGKVSVEDLVVRSKEA